MRLKVTLLCWLKMLTKEAEYRVILYFVVFFTIVSVILSGATREIFMKPVRLQATAIERISLVLISCAVAALGVGLGAKSPTRYNVVQPHRKTGQSRIGVSVNPTVWILIVSAFKMRKYYLQTASDSGGLSPPSPTGALPLDLIGGFPSPRPSEIQLPPNENSVAATDRAID